MEKNNKDPKNEKKIIFDKSSRIFSPIYKSLTSFDLLGEPNKIPIFLKEPRKAYFFFS